MYVAAEADRRRVEQRIIEESGRLTSFGAVTGWAAIRIHGGGFFDGLGRDGRTELPVPLALGVRGHLRRDGAITLSRERLEPDEIQWRYGVPVTAVRRALFDEMRRTADLRDAVVAMDMAAAAELASLRQLREYVADHRGWRRSRLVETALDLAVEESLSPPESRMRLVWELDAGFPRPLCNRAIFDLGGRFLGTPDLLDPVAGVVGEYDGADHRERARHRSDVRREAAFRRVGLEYFEIVAGDSVGEMVDRMTEARGRAAWAAPADRRWTITDPRTYDEEPMTLDERLEYRALIAADRGPDASAPNG